EEIWSDNRRSHHGQRFGVRLFEVVETMNHAARNEPRFTWSNVHNLPIHSKSDDSGHSVYGFIVVLVRMGQRDFSSDRHGEFKQGYRTVRLGGLEQKANPDLPDADDFIFHSDCVCIVERAPANSPGFFNSMTTSGRPLTKPSKSGGQM